MNKTLSKLFFSIVFSLASLSANAGYTFTHLGSVFSYGLSINNSGQIAGNLINSPNNYSTAIYNNGAWNSLGALNDVSTHANGFSSYANGLNNSGQVVGWSYVDNTYKTHAVLWNGATPSDLGALTSTYTFNGSSLVEVSGPGWVTGVSEANAINDSNQIVGWSGTINGPRATLWENGSVVDLGAISSPSSPTGPSFALSINNSGQIVGWAPAEGNYRAFLWHNGVATNLGALDSYDSSQARSINSAGQIVGVSGISGSNPRATLWSNGVMTALPTFNGATISFANAINSSGQIVGFSSFADNIGGTAALWDGDEVIDLNSFLSPSMKAEGWVLAYAVDINDSGSIVVMASNVLLGLGDQAFLMSATPVPEADTAVMLLMGAGVMGFMVRRRKNTQA